MLMLLALVFCALLVFFLMVYFGYYALVRSYARKPWNVNIDQKYRPSVSILIPTHNEEKNIGQKLDNIVRVSYPEELIEIIVVDDASTDRTLSVIEGFLEKNQVRNLKIVRQDSREGKSAALNKALGVSSNQIVIVSDADTTWDKDILEKAIPYLADPKVGATTSVGINSNERESWVTKGEGTYLNFVSVMRTGESKLYSTIRFEGGFCAYKKEAFDHFDDETGADDSGTALNIVQNGWRTILVPEAVFYTWFPSDLSGKMKTKIRRANQLIGLWIKCFRLMLRRQLRLPKKIAIPQLLLFIANPTVLLSLTIVAFVTVALFPFSFFSLALVLLIGGSLLLARRIFLEVLVDNIILLFALFSFLVGKRYISWESH